MKHDFPDVPRSFSPLGDISLRDVGWIDLDAEEQVTFRFAEGMTNDVVRKDWGFYLTNSLNANLTAKGFKTALVVSYASDPPRTYINVVAVSRMAEFEVYLEKYSARVVTWLDEWFAAKA